jgi:indole-3-glycerol phosphate synthase
MLHPSSTDSPKEAVMTILDTIVAEKHREIARLPREHIDSTRLRELLELRGGTRNFFSRLAHPTAGDVAVIAEIKKASPSAGVIRPDFDPLAIAKTYEAAGASCLSVLTDERFFQGSLKHLRQIRSAVSTPLLRKDFIIDERQILEAVDWGADAILLIVAILPDPALRHLHDLATGAGLSVLVEVHNEAELERALAVQPRLIGINNRDLRTFKVDLATTERLAARLDHLGWRSGDNRGLIVAESGIHTRADVERLTRCGADAILVGESLMRPGVDVPTRMQELIGIRSAAA